MKPKLWCGLVALMLGANAAPVAAIPPPPPAQAGSEVGTYDCGRQSLTVDMNWNYKRGQRREYVVRIDGKNLSHADAKRLTREIEHRGPFQAVSVYCIDGAPYELGLYRYTPSEERLRVFFRGLAVSGIR